VSRRRIWDSPKIMGDVVASLVILLLCGALLLDPVLATGPAIGLSMFSAIWDSYMASIAVPVAAYYSAIWNPEARRAVNPLTGRFATNAALYLGAIVLAIVGFVLVTYFIVPAVYNGFFAYSSGSGLSPVFSLFVQLGLIVGIPLVCVAIASPAGLRRTVGSLRRSW